MYGTLISSVTVGAGGAASIAFSSIPGTYTDLYLVLSTRADNAAVSTRLTLRFNSDSTGANYTHRELWGSGSAVSSTSGTFGYIGYSNANSATASTFGNAIVTIPNYAGSTNKSYSTDVVSENNATEAYQDIRAGLWSNTSAITNVTVYYLDGANNFMQYSTAYLYGLLKGSGGATAA